MPVDLGPKKAAAIQRLVDRVGYFMEAYQNFGLSRQEYNDVGFGAGGPAEITENDLAERFPHLTPAMIASAMSTFDAIDALMDAGHATNLVKLRP